MLGCPLTMTRVLYLAVAPCGLEASTEGKLDCSWKELGFPRQLVNTKWFPFPFCLWWLGNVAYTYLMKLSIFKLNKYMFLVFFSLLELCSRKKQVYVLLSLLPDGEISD